MHGRRGLRSQQPWYCQQNQAEATHRSRNYDHLHVLQISCYHLPSLINEPTIIEPMTAAEWDSVSRIYREGLETGNATFETRCPTWEDWNTRHHTFGRLIARRGDTVAGWAALSPVSLRAVYAGVAEVSVYIAKAHRRKGVGTALLGALVIASERAGLWTLQASVFPENAPSIALHQRHGFRVVGRRERIGCLQGRWRDTVLLERRSALEISCLLCPLT